MSSHRLIVFAAACAFCGQMVLAGTTKNETQTSKYENSEKMKRDVNIIGPIPTSYRGQATGQTTFDGILAEDLQLPTTDLGQSQAQRTFTPRLSQTRSANPTVRVGQFQAESRPDVYNFDGKESITYDGVLASDLMVPYAHVTVLNQARSAPQQYFRQRLPHKTAQQPTFQQFRPALRQANFADSYRSELTLPSSAPNQFQTFQQAGVVPVTSDPSLFQPQTPLERYNQLQQQYQATLAEYRNSLIRFQQHLKKYSTVSKKR